MDLPAVGGGGEHQRLQRYQGHHEQRAQHQDPGSVFLPQHAIDVVRQILNACIRYGVSVCIAGSTGSGKTTIMTWLLSNVPNNRRLITMVEAYP